jgi:hypothetical protein
MKEQLFESNIDKDVFPITERRFAVEEEPAFTLNELSVNVEEAEAEIEHDTSKVEYGPPKEIGK